MSANKILFGKVPWQTLNDCSLVKLCRKTFMLPQKFTLSIDKLQLQGKGFHSSSEILQRQKLTKFSLLQGNPGVFASHTGKELFGERAKPQKCCC